MKIFLIGLGVLGLIAFVISAYVRLAPTDPERWHTMPAAVTNRDSEGGAMRVVGAGQDGLARPGRIGRGGDDHLCHPVACIWLS